MKTWKQALLQVIVVCVMEIRLTSFIGNLLQNSDGACTISSGLPTLLMMTAPTVPWNLHNTAVLSVERLIEAVCYWSKEEIQGKTISNSSSFRRQGKKIIDKDGEIVLTSGNKIVLFPSGAPTTDIVDLPFFSCWRVTKGSKILVSAGGSSTSV